MLDTIKILAMIIGFISMFCVMVAVGAVTTTIIDWWWKRKPRTHDDWLPGFSAHYDSEGVPTFTTSAPEPTTQPTKRTHS